MQRSLVVKNSDHSKDFRVDIQGLRGLAVLLVVIYHAEFSWLTGGFIGVDVFFVISGYVISGILMRRLNDTGRDAKSAGLCNFYARRMLGCLDLLETSYFLDLKRIFIFTACHNIH